MFTKKLEDQFSADLLNTVRGVLDEAKKCPEDCECEKCEDKEEDDEDEMKEGFVSAAQRKAVWANRADDGAGHPDKKKKMKKEGYAPTADEPTEANKKVAQKIRDMMAKEKKPVKEESEELGEVSKATMGRYINKAKDSIDTASYRQGHKEAHGSSSKALEKKLTKRHKGIETAVKKLTKEEADQIDELSTEKLLAYRKKAREADTNKHHVYADEADKKIKKKTGVYNPSLLQRAKAKLRNEESEQIDELSKETMGRYINKAATKMGSQGVTAGLKIAADEKSSKNFKDMAKREKGIATAVKKLTKEEQDFINSLNDADVEQIDELSKDKMLKYLSANKKSGARGGRDTIKRMRGADMAVRKYTARDTKYVRVPATEEVELEEGRGRPPKEGSPAWHAKQKQANDDMVALGMQLRKAKSINKKVRFMDNKEHEISSNHIGRFEDHMAARRTTQEKDNFQRQAHKSHADFVKAVSAPVPKAAKDTGEIVKYR
jgi:hypothetical protein